MINKNDALRITLDSKKDDLADHIDFIDSSIIDCAKYGETHAHINILNEKLNADILKYIKLWYKHLGFFVESISSSKSDDYTLIIVDWSN